MYPSYLIHFNRQHDPKTGKFTFGDGDGDGVSNDHKNQDKSSVDRSARRAETYRTRPTPDSRTRVSRSSNRGVVYDARPYGTTSGNRTFEVKPNRNFTREGTVKTVRAGDTKVGNMVKADRRESPREHKPERPAYGGERSSNKDYSPSVHKPGTGLPSNRSERDSYTRNKPSYTKVPGDSINRTKPTYDKNVWGSVPKYKPTYDKVGPAKGGNKTSETIGNMNATLSRNFTRTNEKEHLYGPSGYDYNAPPSNGSTKYDAEQRNNSNTLKDADYYLRNNKLTNPIEDGKKLVDSAKDREVDTQKITNREATEIFVMRALGQTLHSLYIDDYDERRAKNKELLEITNTKNWNK